MKNLKEIFSGKHGKFTRYAIIITAVFFLFMLLKPGNNLINWVRTEIEISKQEKLIESYREQKRMLEDRIRFLESDRDTLEKYAREEFHLAAPGEDVYILED